MAEIHRALAHGNLAADVNLVSPGHTGGLRILLVSLIGHYERTAEYLARQDTLLALDGVKSVVRLRVAARSPLSLLRAVWSIARHVVRRDGRLIGVPRSNSRAIRLLTAMFKSARYFSYSDGLGDSVHHFHLEGKSGYAGHVGVPGLSRPPLAYEIPLRECIEPWGERVDYDPAGPVLLIVKWPKETAIDAARLARLYQRTAEALARHRPLVVTGQLPDGMPLNLPGQQAIGPLSGLPTRLALSAAVGLPSTAFLTLSTRLPQHALRVMRLCAGRTCPDGDRRVQVMKRTLERCMLQLQPASETKQPP